MACPPACSPSATATRQFNFTGGVFQVLNIDRSMTDITQTAASGPSLLDVTGNSTAINVNYTLTGNGTNAATVNVGSGQTLTMGNGVTLTLGDNAQFGTGSGTIQGAVAVTGSTNTTFAGSIADASSYSGSLMKNGAGMLILSGNNTYTGPTTVSGGTLQIGNGTSGEGLVSSITMSNNATVAFNHADPLSYSGTISGSGQLIKLGTGNLDLVGSGTYSGPTTISAGTLELDGNGDNLPAATALTIAASGVLDLAGNPLTVGSLSGSAGAVVTNHYSPAYASTLTVAPSAGSTTFAGNITGNDALALSGSGQLTLSGTNTYTGGTTVSGGTLDIAAPQRLVWQRIGDDRRRRAAGLGKRRRHRRIACGLAAGQFERGCVECGSGPGDDRRISERIGKRGDARRRCGVIARRRRNGRRRNRRGRAGAGNIRPARRRCRRADRLGAATAKGDIGPARRSWASREVVHRFQHRRDGSRSARRRDNTPDCLRGGPRRPGRLRRA